MDLNGIIYFKVEYDWPSLIETTKIILRADARPTSSERSPQSGVKSQTLSLETQRAEVLQTNSSSLHECVGVGVGGGTVVEGAMDRAPPKYKS